MERRPQRSCSQLKRLFHIRRHYFAVSFSVALLFFSLLFYLMTVWGRPVGPQSLDAEPVLNDTASSVPGSEEALSVLFVGVSPDGKEAGVFLLVRFDPGGGKVPIVAFPPKTAVRNGDRVETLAEVYRYGGASFTSDTLAETLGVEIDRYVRMDEAGFLVAASTIGTAEFDLPYEIPIGEGDAPLTLSPGPQLLDARKASGIIGYRGYTGGELERCKIISQLAASVVNQRMDIALSAVLDKVFQKIVNLVETDISYGDYEERKEAAAFLARVGQNPAAAMEVSGSYSADGSRYVLDDTFVARLIQEML